MEVIAR